MSSKKGGFAELLFTTIMPKVYGLGATLKKKPLLVIWLSHTFLKKKRLRFPPNTQMLLWTWMMRYHHLEGTTIVDICQKGFSKKTVGGNVVKPAVGTGFTLHESSGVGPTTTTLSVAVAGKVVGAYNYTLSPGQRATVATLAMP